MSANIVTPQMTEILIIFGSPHNKGYTATLLDKFIEFIPENVILHRINAYNLNAVPCNDCGFCKVNDKCRYTDLDEFDRLYNDADIVIYATPIYNLSFPSPLKSIIDRSQRYFNARFCRNIKPVFQKPKRAVLLATCGSENLKIINGIETTLKQMFTVMNTQLVGSVLWFATDSNDEKYKNETFLRAEKIAKTIMMRKN